MARYQEDGSVILADGETRWGDDAVELKYLQELVDLVAPIPASFILNRGGGVQSGPAPGAAGTSPWTVTGSTIHPITVGNEVSVGSSVSLGLFTARGDTAGQITSVVRAAAGQSADIFVVEDNAGTDILQVQTTGVIVTGKLTVTGAIDPTSVLLSGGTALFYESGDGVTAPVSGAATGRIRYNNTGSGNWQISVQGGAFANLVTGTGPESPWTTTGAVIHPDTLTQEVSIGTASSFGKLTLVGDATGQVTMLIRPVTAQTANIFEVENFDGSANHMFVTDDGHVMMADGEVANIKLNVLAETSSGTNITTFRAAAAPHTALPAGQVPIVDFDFGVTQTFTGGGGPIALVTPWRVTAPTYAAGAAQVLTRAVTARIASAPAVGANITITNPFALTVDGGAVGFNENLGVGNAFTIPTARLEVLGVGDAGAFTATTTLTSSARTTVPVGSAPFADVDIDLSATVQITTGALIALTNAMEINPPTYSATAATQTITDAITLRITGPPVQGADVIITNPIALDVVGTIRMSAAFDHNGATFGALGAAPAVQQSIVALTDNSGGSADDTIAVITNAANAGSADVGPTADAVADLAAKVNEIRTLLNTFGFNA